MECVEFGDDLDVVDVKQNSAKNGRGTVCLVLFGHLPGFREGQPHLFLKGIVIVALVSRVSVGAHKANLFRS